MPTSHEDNHGSDTHHAHDMDDVGIAVITVSSTRDLDHDSSGDRIVTAIEESTHHVVTRELVPDEYNAIQNATTTIVDQSDVQAVVMTGGTGITPDDVTVDAVTPLFDKTLPGFGEFFRRRSAEDIGLRAMGSRAVAGISDTTIIVSLPGSTGAVDLGMELLLPELGHFAGLATQ